MTPTKDEIKAWLKKHGRSREWLGKQCGDISKKTVNNWLSSPQEIPPGTLHLIARLMEDDEREEALRREQGGEEMSHVTLRITTDELNDWSRAFKLSNADTLEAWALDAIRAAYQEDLQAQKTIKYPELSEVADRAAEAPTPHGYASPGEMAKAVLEDRKRQARTEQTPHPNAD